MRKILLSDSDVNLFDDEMIPGDLEFLTRHKDVFRRMWLEQGKVFWSRFVLVFRSYIVRYSLMRDLPCDLSQLQSVLDYAFNVIEENFVNGKANQAKNLIFNIAHLGQNKFRFVHLDSKSFTKDPFYTKETRDLFREFFGSAKEKASYIKVYLLSPVYMRFGGSIVRCLDRWKKAEEIDPSDNSYWTPPATYEEMVPAQVKLACLCPLHLQDCNMRYYQEFVAGDPSHPLFLSEIWNGGNPRATDPGNPLYDPRIDAMKDWRQGLTCLKFQEFFAYCLHTSVKPELQCPDCRELFKKVKRKLKKKKKKAAPPEESAAQQPGPGVIIQSQGNTITIQEMTADGDFRTSVLTTPYSSGTPNAYSAALANSTPLQPHSHISSTAPCAHKHKHKMQSSSGESYDSFSQGKQEESVSYLCNDPFEYEMEAFQSLDTPMSESKKRESKEPPKRTCFSANSVTFKRKEEITLPACGENGLDLTGTFQVEQRQDPTTRCRETVITLKGLSCMSCLKKGKPETCEDYLKNPPKIENMLPNLVIKLSVYQTDDLPKLVPGLPHECSWLEGANWCAVSVDYSAVDGATTAAPTKFNIKISNSGSIGTAKLTMEKLLLYVVQRKKRASPGWLLAEDDIFTVLVSMKEQVVHLCGASFSISTGMLLHETLTAVEEKSLATLPKAPDSATSTTEFTLAQIQNMSSCVTNVRKDNSVSKKEIKKSSKHTTQKAARSGVESKAQCNCKKATPSNSRGSRKVKSHTENTALMYGKKLSEPIGNLAKNSVSSQPLVKAKCTAAACCHTSNASAKPCEKLLDRNFGKGATSGTCTGPENDRHCITLDKKSQTSFDLACLQHAQSALSYNEQNPMRDVSVTSHSATVKTIKNTNSQTISKGKYPPFIVNLGGLESENDSSAAQAKSEEWTTTAIQLGTGEMIYPSDPMFAQTHAYLFGYTDASSASIHINYNPSTPSTHPLDGQKAIEVISTEVISDVGVINNDKASEFSLNCKDPLSENGRNGKNPLSKTDQTGETRDGGDRRNPNVVEKVQQERPLNASSSGNRLCANCLKKEPKPKAYKKCQRCKEERVHEARYYCGRQCQSEDWVAKHRDEHNMGQLI